MAVETFWDDVRCQSLHHILPYHWTLADAYLMFENTRLMLADVKHIVHMVIEFQGDIHLPLGLLGELRSFERMLAPNQGEILIANNSHLLQVMVMAGKKIAPRLMKKVRLVKNVQEAYRVLENELLENNLEAKE